jgi:hypothetical protein
MTAIFWYGLFGSALLLFILTLAGQAMVPLLPARWHAPARYYLTPAFGLAGFILLCTLFGWWLPMARAWPWLVLGLLLLIWRGWQGRRGLAHALGVAGFGLLCGASLLLPLAHYGSVNGANSDTFTYLQQAQWLQTHPFAETVTDYRPNNIQIISYQREYLRMGASFVLAGWHAILHVANPMALYSSILLTALASAALAMGWPLMRALRRVRRATRGLLLSLPALSMGGLVFGAHTGFLPQTIGLALALAALGLLGSHLQWLSTWRSSGASGAVSHPAASHPAAWYSAVPCAILLCAAIFAYSEMAPFLALVGLASLAGYLYHQPHSRVPLIRFALILVGLCLLLLNLECWRIVKALQSQAGSVVGSAVDWHGLGFLLHALGWHAGPWDPRFQWAMSDASGLVLGVAALLLALPIAVTLYHGRTAWHWLRQGAYLPPLLLMLLLLLFGLYFRYGVASPFPVGTGQSWSQFKLSDWAHPFISVWLLWCLLALRPSQAGLGRRFWLLGIGALWAVAMGTALMQARLRVEPLSAMLGNQRNIARTYQNLREAVQQHCPATAPVYLNLNPRYWQAREMLVLYLADRGLYSNWHTDHYFDHLNGRLEAPGFDHCLIDTRDFPSPWIGKAHEVGLFRVGQIKPELNLLQTGLSGAYPSERDQYHWWHWVGKRVETTLLPRPGLPPAGVRLRFGLVGRSPQTVTLRWQGSDGKQGVLPLPLPRPGQLLQFDQVLPPGAGTVRQISLETDGKATRFNREDRRETAFMLLDFTVELVKP